MRMKLTKWGNSLGIRLPKLFAVHIGMLEGSEVEVELRDNSIVVSNPERSLKAMLSTITPAMLHGETEIGHGVGNEVW